MKCNFTLFLSHYILSLAWLCHQNLGTQNYKKYLYGITHEHVTILVILQKYLSKWFKGSSCYGQLNKLYSTEDNYFLERETEEGKYTQLVLSGFLTNTGPPWPCLKNT